MVKPFAFTFFLNLGVSIGRNHAALILHNATVYTMSDDLPYASIICIERDRIVAVGDGEVFANQACTNASVVDLGGAVVVPGLTDSHAHLMMEAARRTRADLTTAHSAEEAAQSAADFARSHPHLVKSSGGWVQGFGWDQTQWPGGVFPTRQVLDAIFPKIPVYLEQLSGHACWINSEALTIVGSDIPKSGDPPGGHIERDANGDPTGVLSDGACGLITKHVPSIPDAEANDALSEVLRDCAANGLTGVHDLDALDADIDLFQRRHSNGSLTLRVYAMRDGATSSPKMPKLKTEDGMITVRGVKFFSDGAMGSWSAALLEPYSDKPNVSGTLVYTYDSLLKNVSAWAAEGYQIATHAIGDAGNREVLDVYAKLLGSRRGEDLRWRIEHAQILSKSDIPRFASLGVIPSMQPSHCASDLSYAMQRLGFDRASRSYAWNTLLKTGIHALPFGSDFPTAGTIPPLLGFHAAVTRETADGIPRGGWFPNQRVTRSQALRGYTFDAAFASFRENELGSIKSGYFADLTILDSDLLTTDADRILNITVLGTIVGGRVVHSRLAQLPVSSNDRGRDQHRPVSKEIHVLPKLGVWWNRYARDMRADHGGDLPPMPIVAGRSSILI